MDFDWNWLWVPGEIAVACACFYLGRANRERFHALRSAANLNIDNLKELDSSIDTIDYALVHGLVRPIEKSFKSKYQPEIFGVIQTVTFSERKLQKIFGFWKETARIIKTFTRNAPFKLITSSDSTVVVENPTQFQLMEDLLDVLHQEIIQNPTSALQKTLDVIAGENVLGIETKEEMLVINTAITAVGTLKKQTNGVWSIIPHEKWGGLLVKASPEDVIQEYKDLSEGGIATGVILLLAAAGTAGFLYYRYKKRKQNQ